MNVPIRAVAVPTVLLLICGCGQQPRIDISPVIENGQVVFNVPFSGINGLLSFGVNDGNDTLWAVSTSYEKGHKIVYGALPNGGNMAAKQTFPPQGSAIPDIRGKKVTAWVVYQYDSGFAACSGSFEKIVDIP